MNLACGSMLADVAVSLSGGDMMAFSFNYGTQEVQARMTKQGQNMQVGQV